MKQLKIGVIGVGNMGKNHLRILSEERGHFDLAGIYDVDLEHAEKLAAQYEVKAFPEVDALLEQLEAVVIAVPSSLHKELGLLAAAHGVHALIEKPLAVNSDQAGELCRAFAAHGRKLAVGHVERFNPVVSVLSKILKHEQIIAMEARRYSSFDGRIKDANVVEDLMIHDIDLVCSLMQGHCVTQVSSLGRVVRSDRLDFVQGMLRFDNGVQATVSASRVTEDKVRELDIHTRDSFIKTDLLAKTLQISKNTSIVIDDGNKNSYKQDGITQKIFVPMVEPLRAELISFYESVVNDAPVEVDGRTAAGAISLCEEIIRCAALTGGYGAAAAMSAAHLA